MVGFERHWFDYFVPCERGLETCPAEVAYDLPVKFL